VSHLILYDISIGTSIPYAGVAGDSIGIRLRGREFVKFEGSILVFADRPIVIADNPDESIDCDHFAFSAAMLLEVNSPTQSAIEITENANVTSLVIGEGGSLNVTGGCHAIKWLDDRGMDPESSSILGVRVMNLRHERPAEGALHSIYIDNRPNPTTGHRRFFSDVYIGGATILPTGVYFRGIKTLTLGAQVISPPDPPVEALNVDSSVENFSTAAEGYFTQAHQTVSLNSVRLLGSALVQGATPHAAVVAVFGGSPLTGSVAPGDQFTVAGDSTVYMAVAAAAAASNQITVQFRPGVTPALGWPDSAAVSVLSQELEVIEAQADITHPGPIPRRASYGPSWLPRRRMRDGWETGAAGSIPSGSSRTIPMNGSGLNAGIVTIHVKGVTKVLYGIFGVALQ
jgi:hypothetical protein